jgi:hypothetical protein
VLGRTSRRFDFTIDLWAFSRVSAPKITLLGAGCKGQNARKYRAIFDLLVESRNEADHSATLDVPIWRWFLRSEQINLAMEIFNATIMTDTAGRTAISDSARVSLL